MSTAPFLGREATPCDVPPYRILRTIGSGPRGTVYEVTEGRRRLALKLYAPGVSPDPSTLERFSRGSPERIRHPNLAPVEDYGTAPSGRAFVVLPLFSGDSIAAILRDLERGRGERPSLSPLSVGPAGELHPELPLRAAEVFAGAADGLGRAHEAGIVHGRLGPGNLHLSPAGRLLVSDFGGADRTLSPADDVAALGAVLRDLLSRARLPVPRDLEACVRKATAPHAEDRPRDGREFARDLERCLCPGSPLAAAATGEARAAPPARRRRGLPLGARRIAAALALAACLGAAYAGGRRMASDRKLTALDAPRTHSAIQAPRTHSALETRAERLELLPLRNSLERDLETPAASVRAAALGRLAAEISNGLRPAADASLALRSLHPRDPLVARRAVEVLALAGSGSAILEALRIGEGEPETTIDGATFDAACRALESAFDPAAVAFLCGLDLELSQVLDLGGAAGGPASGAASAVRVPPNLRVELGRDDPRGYRALWIRVRSRVDPAELIRERRRLAADPALASELAAGLERIRTPEAEDALAALAREDFVSAGEAAVAALARLGAHRPLLELARSELPRDYRERVLARAGELLGGLCVSELRELALRSPDPSIRRLAFASLSRHEDGGAVAAIPLAAGDPALRSDALSFLHRLPARLAAPIAVELAGHPDAIVRAHAVAVLASLPSGVEVAPLARRLLSPEAEARAAAASVLLWRRELARVPEVLKGLLGGIAQASSALGRLAEPAREPLQ